MQNLNGTVDAWNTSLNPLQQLLSPVVAGGQYEANFEAAAGRIMADFKAGNLSREEVIAAVAAMERAATLMPEFIDTPGLDKGIADLRAWLAKNQPRDPKETAPQPGTVKPGDNLFRQVNDFKKEQQATKNAIENAKSISSRENAAIKGKAQETKNAIANAKSINSRENSAIKSAQVTTTSATRTAGQTVALSMTSAANRIVTAVNGLDLSVNVTTVNQDKHREQPLRPVGRLVRLPADPRRRMTLRYCYRNNDGDVVEIINPSRVRRTGTEASYQAEEGAVGTWDLEVDDPDGTFNVRGYPIVYAQEDEAVADDQHGIIGVWYTGERYISRLSQEAPAKRTEARPHVAHQPARPQHPPVVADQRRQ